MIGTSVDRYEILEELGHGGMSVVYRGMDSSLEREVAVKVLHNHLAKKLENRKRFHREAKAIARLRHPNILEVYDFSSEDAERSYIVMEYVAGENLRQFIARTGTPPPEAAALVALEICNALEHAHDHGIIHRDLKPENIMVSSSGELKPMDFGIAHVIDAETMTATGSLMGSPAHMAPELIDGKPVDVRADIFALGTVLYWLATGRLPFEGANAPQVLRRVLEGDYYDPELAEPKIGTRIGDIIRRCLAHDPDDRFTSVLGVRKELETVLASMGLSNTELELKKYLKDPDGYREAFEATVVDKLMELARQAERERNVPAAIGYFNRILAYEPDNEDVQRMLDRLCRRRSWRRALPYAAAAVALIAAIGAWVAFSPEDPEPTVPPVATNDPAVALPVDDVSERINESADSAEEGLRRANELAHRLSGDVIERAALLATEQNEDVALVTNRPPDRIRTPRIYPPDPPADADAGIEEAAPETFEYRFRVIPAAATFMIDGRPVDTLKAAGGIELTEGQHTLTATGRGTKSWRGNLQVDGPQKTPLDVVLRWEDGRVQVISNTRAVVWVGDARMKPIGANGKDATFDVPFGPADSTKSEKEITLRVASRNDMANPKTYPVRVKPGQVSTVTVNFDPDP